MPQAPWSEVIPRVPRNVTLTSSNGIARLSCNCHFTIDYGLPCSDVLAVNGLKWSLEDVDIQWLKALDSGDLDSALRNTSAADCRLPCINHREEPLPPPTTVELEADQEPVGDEVDRDSPDEVHINPSSQTATTFSTLSRDLREIITLAGERKDLLKYIEGQLQGIRKEVYSRIQPMILTTEDSLSQVTVSDPTVLPPVGPASCKRTRAAYEYTSSSRRNLVAAELVEDWLGTQKGKQKKKN